MSKRRLLVTGSQGFVGRELLKAAKLIPDSLDIVDFEDPETGRRPDIRDQAAVGRALDTAKPDAIIHLAAIAAPRAAREDLNAAWMTNVIGTLNVANVVLHSLPTTHLVWAGSSEAYGDAFNISGGCVTERSPLIPLNAYGATKAASDVMLQQLIRDGLKATVFRPFNHTGAGQSPDYVVPAFAKQIARIEAGLQSPVLEVGNLTALRDFLDVRDVVNAYLLAVISPERCVGETYNVSTRSPVSIQDILAELLSLTTEKIEVETSADRYVENLVPVASGANDKLRDELSWEITINLKDMVSSVLADQRQLLKVL